MGEPVSSASTLSTSAGAPLPARVRIAVWTTVLSATLLLFAELVTFDALFTWILQFRLDMPDRVQWAVFAAGLVISGLISARFCRIGLVNEYALLRHCDEISMS